MKKADTAIRIAAAFLILIAFAGCSVIDFFSTDNLLRAPKLTGVNAALQQAFESAVGQDVYLVGPLTGEYRSAFILKDCDGDGQEEALVFYMPHGTENNTVHMNLMVMRDGAWRSVADIAGNGSEVYQVDFCNIDREEGAEIAVTWTVPDSKRDKTLSLYKINFARFEQNDSFNPLASVQIFEYFVIDIDSDGQNELFYVYFDTTEEKSGAYAKLLKYSDADTVLYPISEVKFDGRASSLLAVKYDLFDGKYEFFIDCAAGENTYYTEIVQYDAEQYTLTLPVRGEEKDPVAETRRSSQMYSSDINDDGLIEIPVEKSLPDSFIVNDPENDVLPLRYISWQRFEEDGFAPLTNYFVNETGLYSVCLDPFFGELYMIYDCATGEVQFRETHSSPDYAPDEYDEDNEDAPEEPGIETDGNNSPSAPDDLLFTITVVPARQEPQNEAAEEIAVVIGARGAALHLTKTYIESLIEKAG